MKYWKNDAGKVVAMSVNEEYELFVDVELGLQIDRSPNHDNIRWNPFMTPKTIEGILEEYRIEDTGEGYGTDWDELTLPELREHMLKYFVEFVLTQE